MIKLTRILRAAPGFVGAVCLVSAASARADDGPKNGGNCGPEAHGHFGPPPGEPLGFEEDRPPPYLMGLKLSDDQQDKVFAILHAAAPELRAHAKAARRAREAVRDLGHSVQFDEGNAAKLTQAQATAEGQLALSRARAEHDIYLILRAEQRTRLLEQQRDSGQHRGDGPPPR